MSSNSRVVPLRLPTTTNPDFLKLIFEDQWDQVLVTSFKRDPADPDGPREDWNAWKAGDVLTNPHFDEGNTYFCPSLLVPGTRDRQLDNFRSLHVIVIDDIGTKINLVEVVALLRIPPTYIIETSPGNHQAGWKIEAETDLSWVKGMLVQLDNKLGRKADNLTNPVAWRRLPVGWNTKATWVQQLGPQGFKVRLKKDYPGPMIRGLDWPCEIEDQIGVIQRLTTLDRGTGDAQRPDDQVLLQDPIYRALEEAGHILGDKLTSDKFWAATIKCPWVANHGPTRPLTGAEYVPAIPGQRGWFHCFHCEQRKQGEFREQLDLVLRDEGQRIVAAFEFDDIDPAAITHLALPYAAVVPGGEAIDLWDQKVPPAWPGGVLPAIEEDDIADQAERNGLDLGALGAVTMTTYSGACDKRTMLTPYASASWRVRPILWSLLVQETGLRKTGLLYPLTRLRALNHSRMKQHKAAQAHWLSTPKALRQGPAPAVAAVLAEDTTIEWLQVLMADNSRGLLYTRDEMAGMLDFGRYSAGPGAAERAFFLEAYDGGPTTIGRMTRTTVIENTALALLGGIQQQKLAQFKGLEDDGLLSRMGIILARQTASGVVKPGTANTRIPEATINRLLANGVFDDYRTDDTGEAMIRDTEALGRVLASRPDIGVGFRGFFRKLHGLHARTALILHMIDGGHDQIIPTDTVTRAGRYIRFLYQHAEVFYAGLPGSADATAQAIGSFILRKPIERITAGQLRRDIAACKPLQSSKEIQDAVFLLVIGGWLVPENNWPSNTAWRVRPGLRDQFAARIAMETERTDRVKAAMNQWGRHR